jgi:hypothetical protein
VITGCHCHKASAVSRRGLSGDLTRGAHRQRADFSDKVQTPPSACILGGSGVNTGVKTPGGLRSFPSEMDSLQTGARTARRAFVARVPPHRQSPPTPVLRCLALRSWPSRVSSSLPPQPCSWGSFRSWRPDEAAVLRSTRGRTTRTGCRRAPTSARAAAAGWTATSSSAPTARRAVARGWSRASRCPSARRSATLEAS